MIRFAILAFSLILTGAPHQAEPDAAILKEIHGLRAMKDEKRAAKTKELALRIRAASDGPGKVMMAESLGNLATEGDFGPGTLQTVADTLWMAIKATPPKEDDFGYTQLANLARYEEIKVGLESPAYRVALAKVDALEKERAKADFTLVDRSGKSWTRSALKGKVVLINFWATWCPPCRKEMPDLSALQTRFKDRLIILGISDEKGETVDGFLKKHPVTYPILLDPGRKINDLYKIDGIPKNLFYDRNGRLAAQSIDMRTMPQFLKLLAKAGLR